MKLSWYFDYISPFAYLQLHQLKDLPKNIEIEYKPILFAGLLKHFDNVGPAEIPAKRTFTYKHCYWKARALNIPFKMPPAHPFNSLFFLRLTIALNNELNVIQHLFKNIWQYGNAMDSEITIDYLNTHLGNKDWTALTQNPNVKNQLLKNTQQAAEESVFGVPSLVTEDSNKEVFWGVDSFDMLTEYLQSHENFYDEEMSRYANLPIGVARKR